jgi:uncharacterized protein (TIGR02996 family)
MDSTLEALQIETRLHPDDDAPRLVLADWLEENGDDADRARAELIRVQCQLARTRGPLRADLEWRERSLWWDNVETWLGPIYDASTSFQFRRGLATIDLDGGQVADRDCEELFAAPGWAWVERLNVAHPRPRLLACLLRSPAVARLRGLHLEGGTFGRDDPGLAGCDTLGLLQELSVRRADLDDQAADALASCPSLSGLTNLDLAFNRLRAAALCALGQSPALASLTALELAGNPLRGEDDFWDESALPHFRAFLTSPLAGRLTRLGLAQTNLGESWVYRLAVQSKLSRLVDLDLAENRLGDDCGIEALAESPVLAALRRLVLRDNHLDERDVLALARSPHLQNLEVLDLSGNGLSSAALRALCEAPGWWKLRKLRVGRGQVPSPRLLGELRGRYGIALDVS